MWSTSITNNSRAQKKLPVEGLHVPQVYADCRTSTSDGSPSCFTQVRHLQKILKFKIYYLSRQQSQEEREAKELGLLLGLGNGTTTTSEILHVIHQRNDKHQKGTFDGSQNTASPIGCNFEVDQNSLGLLDIFFENFFTGRLGYLIHLPSLSVTFVLIHQE